MKLTLPANVPVTFYPDCLDDNRKDKPTLQFFRQFPIESGSVRAFLAIDGTGFELHHQSGAKALISLDDIFQLAIQNTFGSLHLDVTLSKQEQCK